MENNVVKGRVSVLMPCYNGEKYIERSINAVLAQTWKDIELIIVNDGSCDLTEKVIACRRGELKTNLSAFIYMKQENSGVGAAINTALKYFTGEFITLLDCDDYMMPESIEIRAMWLTAHPQTAVVQNNGYYVAENDYDNENRRFCEADQVQENIPLFDLILDGKTYNWSGSYMIRSETWLKRCPDREIYCSRSGQNLQMLLPAAYKNRCDYIPDCLMKYGLHTGSLSNTDLKQKDEQIKDILGYQDIYQTVLKSFLPEESYHRYRQKVETLFARRIMDVNLRYNDKIGAETYYKYLQLNGECSLDDRISYYKVMNRTRYYWLRVYRKLIGGADPTSFNLICRLRFRLGNLHMINDLFVI